jgi:UDP-N-acetylmuramate: L-alanyl-gamma-D-glutamyl-meso-diaminopimelate ligase
MRKIHFIAIGGAAMHNLALALHQKGYQVTGSDDEIAEPSRSRLKEAGLLPLKNGWNAEKISDDIDAVIIGMHARKDNPELIKAIDLRLRIYSYPEFLYEQTRRKKRVVIAGSHGKTSVTSMVMHILKHEEIDFDYMVGAKIDGFDTMVALNDTSEIAIFEGDEYLSSPIDLKPKFLHYRPHIAIINGIAWDHINVFPTFEIYVKQFSNLINVIEPEGILIYNNQDKVVNDLVKSTKRTDLKFIPFDKHPHLIEDEQTFLLDSQNRKSEIQIFGDHNMLNIAAAKETCRVINVNEKQFYRGIKTFQGSAKRLQKIYDHNALKIFLDFAHAPSKLKATIHAVRKQFPNARLISIFELHTFSSLNKKFLNSYDGTTDEADQTLVYFNPQVVENKKLEPLTISEVQSYFNSRKVLVVDNIEDLKHRIEQNKSSDKTVFLFMSSGNFSGKNIDDIIEMCVQQ